MTPLAASIFASLRVMYVWKIFVITLWAVVNLYLTNQRWRGFLLQSKSCAWDLQPACFKKGQLLHKSKYSLFPFFAAFFTVSKMFSILTGGSLGKNRGHWPLGRHVWLRLYFSSENHQPPLTTCKHSSNTYFPIMTSGFQLVADQSVGLCDWGLVHFILHCHMSKMADKLMSHG